MAATPETSAHTSLYNRIQALKAETEQPDCLLPFVGNPRDPMPKGLPFRLEDYLQLVDWTGRIIRDDKRGAIPQEMPPILDRLDIEPKNWLYLTTHFESSFKGLVGHWFKLKRAYQNLGYQRTPGLTTCRQLL